jgi:hypothetical protein
VVNCDRLLSASDDGTICEWEVGTWAALRTIRAFAPGGEHCEGCLVVIGSKLVSGSWTGSRSGRTQLRVWDLASLKREHTLLQPACRQFKFGCLAAGRGQVWAGMGQDVVVWGHEG